MTHKFIKKTTSFCFKSIQFNNKKAVVIVLFEIDRNDGKKNVPRLF
uniref:Uncharacterized protein n=1 Tax=Anguilla anguilla TaxID=7936 RepID=A0A0E9WGR4_ANGAN